MLSKEVSLPPLTQRALHSHMPMEIQEPTLMLLISSLLPLHHMPPLARVSFSLLLSLESMFLINLWYTLIKLAHQLTKTHSPVSAISNQLSETSVDILTSTTPTETSMLHGKQLSADVFSCY
jgi:hypothetical protein